MSDTPPTPQTNKVALAGVGGGLTLAVYVVDRLLANDGHLAATMLSNLSPLLGPVWASWPVIAVLVAAGVWAGRRLNAWQRARSDADLAAATAATELKSEVGAVVAGLTGLRTEVHEMRAGMTEHIAQTNEEFRGLKGDLNGVKGEVVDLRGRVAVIEAPKPKPRKRRKPVKKVAP